MKVSKLILNNLVLVTILTLGACNRGNQQQSGTGSTPQQGGGGSSPSKGSGY
jgi:hypothetical protein